MPTAAVDTFLRAQALIRAERPSQDPVIAGTAEARSTPFLCSGRAPIRRSALAVERVGSDGNVIVQGGWAHGLTIGSELRLARGGDVRLEVREMLGLGRCQARLLGPRGMPAGLTSGALLEIAGWASPPARPLRVWMPKTTSAANLVEWAGKLAHVASQRHVRWIDDPIAETPMHLLRWRSDGWELLAQNGEVIRFPAGVAPGAVVAKLSPASSLFVQLPVPAWLVKAIDVGPGTSRAAIQPVDHPEEADYLLAGRFALGALEYAWVRPLVTQRDRQRTPLPLASAWRPASAGVGAALGLQDAVLQLRRIYAWQSLESPPGSRAAYDLVLRRRSDGVPVRDRVLVGGQRYTVALHACPGSPPKPRYIYAFLIDSYGRSVLLYPRGGSVENRFPLPSLSPPPAEIALDAPFDVREPYGVDTYFLLTTDEQLPDPSILEWDGVRGRPAVKTALEELLTETSSVNRSAQPVRTMANWSIDRLLFESIPAKPKGSS